MNEIAKREDKAPVSLVYHPVTATFEDQFGNKVKGVFCKCGSVGLEKDFAYYNNYGGTVRKGYLCNGCFSILSSVSDRVTRDRSKISHAHLGPSNWGKNCCIK